MVCKFGSITFIFSAVSVPMVSRFHGESHYWTIYLITFSHVMERSLTIAIGCLDFDHVVRHK